ncbi:MAG: membrane-associated alkaline phosphatase [Candidatus Magnetoglobus multicellularis str. Araruama]|uniref:Membrane-associated alkaline phosphatase n=1 Tax=Candidatus Magnetoglobus multicellularis str. Araruama TaxID=890399 RepID=A0A1V1P7H7_9BACT|nr:MAG: membrane-associated alkaline phosphatase [Candidatus Magnetoglobus multicellularis str. Araruama]
MKRLYDWVLSWAHSPYGVVALFVLAFCESSFFPIPPDVLLIALSVSLPKRSYYFALICSIGSVFGGLLGYYIGYAFMSAIGMPIIEFYDLTSQFENLQTIFTDYDAWAIAIAGFTPIPYKVFTISAGAFHVNLLVFTIASLVSRSARFFIIGTLIYFFGDRIQAFIDNYFNILSIAFVIALMGGFFVMKFLF